MSEKTENLLSQIGSSTCISANAYSYDGVLVRFAVPKEAIDFRITRDGESILETSDKSKNSQIDENLTPGQTYRYRCEVILDKNRGYQQVGEELVVKMPISTPPSFEGLKRISLNGNSAALLEWDLTEDAILDHYRVYKYIGVATSNSDFPAEPVAEIENLFAISQIVSDLGDEVTYSFRVAACNSAGICDDNNKILSVTTPDRGAPTTTGANGISFVNGVIKLDVPWSDVNGHVAKRSVYRASVALGAQCPTLFGLYGKVNDVIVTEPRLTPTKIDASGVLNEGQKYCFVVRDTDPSGNTETNLSIQEQEIGDLTNPDFNSQISLARKATSPEDSIVVSWTAMAREADAPLAGASEYLVYISSASTAAALEANPCEQATPHKSVSAASYAAGSAVSTEITGLNSRNWHRVCVRAIDSASNFSAQTPMALIATADVTAPSFAGVQAAVFNSATASVDFSFIAPQDTDVKTYKITTIRTRQGVENSPIVLVKDLGSLVPNATVQSSFTLAEASLADNDQVSVRVDACDDAAPDFNTQNNCSATSAVQSLVIPDATPPQAFTGITSAVRGTAHRSVQVTWGNPTNGSWADYVGFKIYYVNQAGQLVGLNSSDCVCTGNNCATNPKTSCSVTQEDNGTFLTPSKTYEMYVAAFDLVGNQTTSYIAHSGTSKLTALSKAQDTEAPTFNASMNLSYQSGLKILFNPAVDSQDSSLDIKYEVYRKTGATFTCPNTPYSSTGGCDALSPLVVLSGNSLSEEAGKKVYVDTSVADGNHYYYQLCALDDANNRACQPGGVGDLAIDDVTAPVISNVDSNKTVGGGASWVVSFDVSDNIVTPDNLIINIYKSTTAFPDQNNPGIPVYSKSAGTVTVTGNRASFTDTGTADVISAYYLIQVQDLSGNKSFEQARDMLPLPVITSVVWPLPFHANGEPISTLENRFRSGSNEVKIQGQNLTAVSDINSADTVASGVDKKLCETSRITSKADGEIACTLNGIIYLATEYNLYIKDKHNRTVAFNAGSPTPYCDYADANGITELRGLGTSGVPYVLCSPDHIKLIGRNADNPNNTRDYIGSFVFDRDIDFSGVTDFKGIPKVNIDEIYILGNRKSILNMSIDTSATNEEAAFIKVCEGTTTENRFFVRNLSFKNAVVKTGSARGAVFMLDKNCNPPLGGNFLHGLNVLDSELHSNNTAGMLFAEYTASGAKLMSSRVTRSKLFTSRTDSTTAVGLIAGKVKGGSVGHESFLHRLEVYYSSVLPPQGQTQSGDRIGLLIGELSAKNVNLDTSRAYGHSAVEKSFIKGGGSELGGVIGRIEGAALSARFSNVMANGVVIEAGPGGASRGGVVGIINSTSGVRFENVRTHNSIVNGGSSTGVGGVIGFAKNVTGFNFINLPRVNSSSGIANYKTNVSSTGLNLGGVIGTLTGQNVRLENISVAVNSQVIGNASVGGIVGGFDAGNAIVLRASASSNVSISATGARVGGLFGYIRAANVSVDKSAFVRSQVYGGSGVGGIVGWVPYQSSSFSLTNSYVDSEAGVAVQGGGAVGGLIGSLDLGGRPAPVGVFNISKNAVYAMVSATNNNKGVFIGFYGPASDTSQSIFANNYYRNDYTTAGVLTTNPSITGAGQVEGKSSADLGVQATYVNWDFTNTWYLGTGNGNTETRARLSDYNGVQFY